jgi:Holliday junction resolvase
MYKRGKVDDNQKSIVNVLKKVGCSVQTLASMGGGVPDLLVGIRGENYLLEVKTEKGTLTADQERWHTAWRGSVVVVRTAEEAISSLGIKRR